MRPIRALARPPAAGSASSDRAYCEADATIRTLHRPASYLSLVCRAIRDYPACWNGGWVDATKMAIVIGRDPRSIGLGVGRTWLRKCFLVIFRLWPLISLAQEAERLRRPYREVEKKAESQARTRVAVPWL